MDDAARRKVFTSGADQLVRVGPAPRLFVSVCVSWPAPKRGFKDVDPADGDIKRLLSHLAGEHKAVIRAEETDSSVMITVKTTNRPTAQKIIKTLRGTLLYQAGEDDMWRTKLLFNPPADGGRPLVAVLEPVDGTTGRKILTAAPKQLAELVDTASPSGEYKEELVKVLDGKANVMRHTTAGMRMKVQFGTVILNQWRKDKTEYTFAELETLLQRAGPRGTAQMQNLVSESSARALIKWLTPSNPELPELLTGFLKDGDPQRSYSIMMDTKNLHIEATFEPVYGQKSLDRNSNKGSKYALGPLSTYPLEKQLEAAEIITVCPDSTYDWTLEIRKKAVAEKDNKTLPPFTVGELQRHIKFTGEFLDQGFPNFGIADHFLRQHDVKNIHGKTSLKYTLGFKYILEVNLFHRWAAKQPGQGADTTATTTTAAVLLYCDDWEYQMRAEPSGNRDWKDTFAEQFLEYFPDDPAPGGDAVDSTGHFLQWVDFIRKALDSDDSKKD
ncbi:hypothetical protein B0J18DRAFT_363894 [Chaetomium sp. MPI-SDFR-AT-0129]|nr:hypothetical protein B0J18DRAFT_363894 [Chaetomium sp. MPI-SDFR-AT-0129]